MRLLSQQVQSAKVELVTNLGTVELTLQEVQLAQFSVFRAGRAAPKHVLVNGCLIAQGEVVVVNEKFGIRLTDIITPSERIRKLKR